MNPNNDVPEDVVGRSRNIHLQLPHATTLEAPASPSAQCRVDSGKCLPCNPSPYVCSDPVKRLPRNHAFESTQDREVLARRSPQRSSGCFHMIEENPVEAAGVRIADNKAAAYVETLHTSAFLSRTNSSAMNLQAIRWILAHGRTQIIHTAVYTRAAAAMQHWQ